jgi:hypothetical protein
VKIEVTEEDISLGYRGYATLCPIAVAVKRITGIQRVDARANRIRVGTKEVRTPPEAAAFMENFDKFGKGYPFSFEVEL